MSLKISQFQHPQLAKTLSLVFILTTGTVLYLLLYPASTLAVKPQPSGSAGLARLDSSRVSIEIESLSNLMRKTSELGFPELLSRDAEHFTSLIEVVARRKIQLETRLLNTKRQLQLIAPGAKVKFTGDYLSELELPQGLPATKRQEAIKLFKQLDLLVLHISLAKGFNEELASYRAFVQVNQLLADMEGNLDINTLNYYKGRLKTLQNGIRANLRIVIKSSNDIQKIGGLKDDRLHGLYEELGTAANNIRADLENLLQIEFNLRNMMRIKP